MHELDAFLDGQAAGLCHTDYWAALARIWREGDDAVRRDERWSGIWEQARLAPGAQLGLMSDDEQAALAALPDEVALRPRDGEGEQSFDVAQGGGATVARERVVALFLVDGAEQVVAPPAAVRA